MTYIMLINITMGTWLVGSRVGRDGWQWIKVILLIKPTTPQKHVYYSLFSRIWCETTLLWLGLSSLFWCDHIRLPKRLLSQWHGCIIQVFLAKPKCNHIFSTMFISMCFNNWNTIAKVSYAAWNTQCLISLSKIPCQNWIV